MDTLTGTLGWAGIYGPMALGAIGSIIGCSRAGQAACGAMLETESGHGKFIGLSAMPSSQAIYGIVMMFALKNEVAGATPAALGALGAVGLLAGLALLFSAAYQGDCCAAAIHASKSKPEIFGLAIAPAAIVEGFAVFAFIFALVVAASLPEAAPPLT